MDYGLVYLATPYAKFDGGTTKAFIEACKLASKLITQGIKVYSPIAHTHPIAHYGGLDPTNHSLWLPFDELMLLKADSLFIAKMAGWEESRGIKYEIEFFSKSGKPIYRIDPNTLIII